MPCTDVLQRWSREQTPLSCIAELRPGPAVIRMPSCRLTVDGESELHCHSGSVVELPGWSDASVESDWRGTKVELTYAAGTVVIADYDCAGTMKEVMSH